MGVRVTFRSRFVHNIYIYICIYTYIYTHTRMHACMHAYIHVYTYLKCFYLRLLKSYEPRKEQVTFGPCMGQRMDLQTSVMTTYLPHHVYRYTWLL